MIQRTFETEATLLYLDASLELEGLVLFRDYNVANHYYYAPRAPHLTFEGGQPMFQLLIYRRDITDNPDFKEGDRPGGGFLTMTVDLSVPRATLDAAKGRLRSVGGGEIELSAIPVEAGTVRVSALGTSVGGAPALEGEAPEIDDRPHFVERILGAAHPSLYGDNRAVFTIELSHEGALLMRASLEDEGASQIAVIYDLTYRGLMPAYEVQITIDFKQSYQYLRSRFTLNTLVFKTDLDAEFEKLMKEGHIKITEVDYLGSDPAKSAERAQKLNELAKDLATFAFFRPGLQPGKVLAADRGELKAADPTTAAEAVTAGFSTPLQVALSGTGRTGPGASPVPGTTDRAGGIGGHSPTEGAENPAAGQPAGQPSTQADRPLTAVEQWNKAGRPQAAFLMKSLTQEEQQTVTYDLRQVSATTRSMAPQGQIRLAAGTASLRGRIKEVDLQDPFFERISGSVTTTADLESLGITSLVVRLRYGVRPDGTSPKDTQEVVLKKTGDSATYSFFLDSRFSVDLEYSVVATYRAGFAIGDQDLQATSPWIRTTTRNLDVDPAVLGTVLPVEVVVGQSDWTAVRSVQTVLSYDDPPRGVHGERTLLLSQADPSEIVPIRPKDAGASAYTATTTWFVAGSQETVVDKKIAPSTLVLNQPPSRAVPVAVTAADPLGRLQKVSVELSYQPAGGTEQTGVLELVGQGANGTWSFVRPSADAPAAYRYRTTVFGMDGTTSSGPWTETLERQLVVGDRFGAILSVEVRFVGGMAGDLAASGYQGALLSLEYPDAPPGVDGTEEEFFTGVPGPFTWRVPMLDPAKSTYRYSVRYVGNDGTEVVKEGDSHDEVLLLFIPPRTA
jgi:hypothetical protein